ncbi:terminase large subunit domain-containing protein [Achromobacter insolitus]|uniref:terminase large subunit domain-containing protein n=1 Tax=Achromobacter insolitus TaxID=217204 RepID=UPI001E472559|nr:terminase large subunit [Achromobacter insolitus]
MPVLRGELVVGELVMLAVERHYRDLQTSAKRNLYFSPSHAWHMIEYIEKYFVHVKGRLAGQPILLDPWQKFWTAVLYGWRRAGTGLRRFTRAYEEVARKNGKSTWKAPQGAYLFMMDGEPGAEVYAVATTREQAMTVFRPAFENFRRWARKSAGVKRSFRIFEGQNQERIEAGASVFKPIASNADAQDGFNPSAVLYDELHAQRSREQWDVLESGFGAREQPLLSAITTAGFILDGICTEVRSYLISVLRGEREDDSFFGYVYTLDSGDDPFDEEVWVKANPGLGRSKTIDYSLCACHRRMVARAHARRTASAAFRHPSRSDSGCTLGAPAYLCSIWLCGQRRVRYLCADACTLLFGAQIRPRQSATRRPQNGPKNLQGRLKHLRYVSRRQQRELRVKLLQEALDTCHQICKFSVR